VHEHTLGFLDLQQLIGPVQWKTDGPRLFADGLQYGLLDPPHRVGDEVVATVHIVLLNGVHQPDVAFIDEVDQRKSLILIFFCNVHYEPEVGFDKALAGGGIAGCSLAGYRILLLTGHQGYSIDFLEVHRKDVGVFILVGFSHDTGASVHCEPPDDIYHEACQHVKFSRQINNSFRFNKLINFYQDNQRRTHHMQGMQCQPRCVILTRGMEK